MMISLKEIIDKTAGIPKFLVQNPGL